MAENKTDNPDPHNPEGDTGYQEEKSHFHDADEPDTFTVAPSAALAVTRTNVPKVFGSVVVYGNPAEPDSKPNDDPDLLPKGESEAQAGNGAAKPVEQEAGHGASKRTEDLIAELQEKQLLIDGLKDELDRITQLKRAADQALEEAERRHEDAIATKDDEIDGLKEKVEHYKLKLSKSEKKNGKRKEEEEPVQEEQVSKEDYLAELEKKDREIRALRAIIKGRERDAKQALKEAVQRLERAEELERAADEALKQKQRKEQEEAEKLRAKEDEKTQKIERFISVASSTSSMSTSESDTQGCTNLDSQASCDAST